MSLTRGEGRQTVTTAGTAVQLSTTSVGASEVIITAETDNTGIIVVGTSTVVAALATRKGTPLLAGESLVIAIDDLNKISLDPTVSTDGVTYQWSKIN